MSEIVTLLLPFFGLILLGYGAGRFRLINAGGLAGLNFFVFYIALPVLFFQLVAGTPLSSFGGWAFVTTTTFSTYCAFAIAFSIGALINGGNVPQATIEGLVGSHSEIGYLAPALTIAAFGSAAAAPTALVFTFDNTLLLAVTPLMMALGGSMKTKPRQLAEDIGRQVLLHPFVIATALGLLFAATGLGLPWLVDATLTPIRQAAPAAALFTFGVGLSLRPLGRVPIELPVIVAVKLIAHPLIVYLLLSWVGGFDPIWVHTAVLLAALPPAASVLVQAERSGLYQERTATAILLGTIASVVTVTFILILILNDQLPVDPFR